MIKTKLFTNGIANPKTLKSEAKGYKTLILHLAPHNVSGYQVCSSASVGCANACLNTAGRGKMNVVQAARIRKTKLFFEDRDTFKANILAELRTFVKMCDKNKVLPAVRMNGTSDILWEKIFPEMFEEFGSVQFYDYTKHYKRCLKRYKLPENYHLTFSRSETNNEQCRKVLRAGRFNVAVVFDGKNYPPVWGGKPTYSADDDDLRFLDPPGGYVGCLYAKGDGKRDKTGFVLPIL